MITVTLREGAIHNIIHTISKYFDLLHLLRKFGEVMYVVRVSTQTQFLSKFPTSNFQVLSLESFFGTPRRPLLKLGSSKLKQTSNFRLFAQIYKNSELRN